MNKKFLISVVAMFVLSMLIDGVIHAALLKPDYEALGALYRGEQDAQNYLGYMLLAHVFLAIGFAWIYLKGKSGAPFLMQGLRFGLAVALLMTIPGYLIYFAVQPLPALLVFKQIVMSTVGVLMMGVAVAAINK